MAGKRDAIIATLTGLGFTSADGAVYTREATTVTVDPNGFWMLQGGIADFDIAETLDRA